MFMPCWAPWHICLELICPNVRLSTTLSLLCCAVCGNTSGTKINWTAAIRPPHHVRQEWASTYGLAHLGPDSAAFDNALDTVCTKLGVRKGTTMSKPNAILQEGMEALGQHVEE
jgi:hypothetical protein